MSVLSEPSTASSGTGVRGRGRPRKAPGTAPHGPGVAGLCAVDELESLSSALGGLSLAGGYYEPGSRAGAGNPNPMGPQPPQPRPQSVRPTGLWWLSASLSHQHSRLVGPASPYLCRTAADELQPLLAMALPLVKGSTRWPLGRPLPERVVHVLSVLWQATGRSGQQARDQVPADQIPAWEQRVASFMALCRPETTSAGVAVMAAAMLTPRHSCAKAGGGSSEYMEGDYGSSCMEWEEDRLATGVRAHDQQYLRVYLGAGEGRGEEGGAGIDTPKGTPGFDTPAVDTPLPPDSPASTTTATAATKKKPKASSVSEYAHRLVLWAADGPPPSPSHEGVHLCHNPRCLNLMHLAWAPRAVNLAPSTAAYRQALVEGGRGSQLWGVGDGPPAPPAMEPDDSGDLSELARPPTRRAAAKAARARRLGK